MPPTGDDPFLDSVEDDDPADPDAVGADRSDAHPELPLNPDVGLPLHLRPDAIALVFLGGAIGTAARYGLAQLAPTPARGWPTGTFVANLVGAFVLGVLLEGLMRRGADTGWRRRARLLVGTGFCGGLTTYSTFAVENALLVRGDDTGLAAWYLAVSGTAGCLAAGIGIWIATAHHHLVRKRAEAAA
ncbi:fluoride efflux transporter FluC [uncultured Jatrophihabitans sp.]|uniref:fluoride efflux transporter FluC n=1 Tax=uncultured Jatrophihabitans sp. TaxID=1610747 RepID=UPI0035CC518F